MKKIAVVRNLRGMVANWQRLEEISLCILHHYLLLGMAEKITINIPLFIPFELILIYVCLRTTLIIPIIQFDLHCITRKVMYTTYLLSTNM